MRHTSEGVKSASDPGAERGVGAGDLTKPQDQRGQWKERGEGGGLTRVRLRPCQSQTWQSWERLKARECGDHGMQRKGGCRDASESWL